MNAIADLNADYIPEDVARTVVSAKSYTDDKVIYKALGWLRKNMPLAKIHLQDYDPIWIVTKYEDIVAVGRQPALFSNAADSEILYDKANDAFMRSMNNGCPHAVQSLTAVDPPIHTALRGVTANWFMPANVRRLESNIRGIAKTYIDRLFEAGEEIDFMGECALYFPLHVIMSALGVPESDEPKMLRLTQDFFGVHDPDEKRSDVPQTPEAAAAQFQSTLNDFYAYFDKFTLDRRANPRDDLMSIIANAKLDGNYLDPQYVNGYYVAIATAGHDTTSSTTGAAMLGMATNPSQFEKVSQNVSLIPGLIEEALRCGSPVKHFMRTAMEDTQLRGRHISKGDRLMLSYPSANRDEDVFQNADEFNVERSPNRHLAFGYGVHGCLGQHLGKLEMRIFFEQLMPRLKSIELAGEPKYMETNFVGGLKRLPLRIRPK